MAKKSNPKQPAQDIPEPERPESIDIHVNELGEIVRNFDIDELNKFLNRTVPDKKIEDKEEA